MAALEFKFSQNQLFDYTTLAGNNKISVVICSLPETNGSGTSLYLCALMHGANDVLNTSIRPLVACPFPPGWKTEDDFKNIDVKKFENETKLFVDATALKNILPQNLHAPNGILQVSAVLDSKIIATPAPGALKFFVSFNMLAADGATVNASILAE